MQSVAHLGLRRVFFLVYVLADLTRNCCAVKHSVQQHLTESAVKY